MVMQLVGLVVAAKYRRRESGVVYYLQMSPLRSDAGNGEDACQQLTAEEVQRSGEAGHVLGQQQTTMHSKRKARDRDKQVGA